HPREITPEAARVCGALLRAGMPVNNHTVLLKGVNDSLATMRELLRGLLRIKVRPYYIFHCDPVIGAGHFRTSVWKGMELVEGLRGHTSGIGIPPPCGLSTTYVGMPMPLVCPRSPSMISM